jgi:hypothetical protein
MTCYFLDLDLEFWCSNTYTCDKHHDVFHGSPPPKVDFEYMWSGTLLEHHKYAADAFARELDQKAVSNQSGFENRLPGALSAKALVL